MWFKECRAQVSDALRAIYRMTVAGMDAEARIHAQPGQREFNDELRSHRRANVQEEESARRRRSGAGGCSDAVLGDSTHWLLRKGTDGFLPIRHQMQRRGRLDDNQQST